MRRTGKIAFILLAFGLSGLLSQAQTAAEYPQDAFAGQCFARVLVPEVTEIVTEQVEVTPESSRQILVPATYETRNIRVMIKEASTQMRAVPAIYETQTEQVQIKPESVELITIPATYETYTETIEIAPAKAVWKSGDGLYGRTSPPGATLINASADTATGEVLCRVMIPAETRTVRRSRMVTPPRVEERVIPAEYRTVSRQVISVPARVEEVEIPAEYIDVPVSALVTPATTQVEIIPATYRTIEKRVVTTKGGLEWAEVLCETNTTSAQIAAIQRGLTQAGYATEADGVYGAQTQGALENYQRANGLAAGYLTVETVRALGLQPYA